jgi:hypothetical protein
MGWFGKLFLAHDSIVILGSYSCGTHDHILLSRDLWESCHSRWEEQITIFKLKLKLCYDRP